MLTRAFFAAAILAVLLCVDASAQNPAVCIELQDQFGAAQKLAFPATRVTVLTIADKKSAPQVDAWVKALDSRYGKRITIYGLADVHGAPGFMRGSIRNDFRKKYQHPVMLDWSGEVCRQLRHERGAAMILIFDREGAERGRFVGTATDQTLQRVFTKIDAVLDKK